MLRSQQFHIPAHAARRLRIKKWAVKQGGKGEVTGVDEADANNIMQEAVYYNLQRVPVKNPASGIYIRIHNGKAHKIIRWNIKKLYS